ncbi:MAG: FG-GAP repeat protein [Acidobacteriota bacterium]
MPRVTASVNKNRRTSTAGDVNGHGHDDIIVGATQRFVFFEEGAAWIYCCSRDGIVPDWRMRPTLSTAMWGWAVARGPSQGPGALSRPGRSPSCGWRAPS